MQFYIDNQSFMAQDMTLLYLAKMPKSLILSILGLAEQVEMGSVASLPHFRLLTAKERSATLVRL